MPFEFGGLDGGGGAAPPGGAPPGAVLGGGVLFGALGVVLGALGGGFSAGGGVFWLEGAGGSAGCCFEQPAAVISAATATRIKLRFMRAPLWLARYWSAERFTTRLGNKNGSRTDGVPSRSRLQALFPIAAARGFGVHYVGASH